MISTTNKDCLPERLNAYNICVISYVTEGTKGAELCCSIVIEGIDFLEFLRTEFLEHFVKCERDEWARAEPTRLEVVRSNVFWNDWVVVWDVVWFWVMRVLGMFGFAGLA